MFRKFKEKLDLFFKAEGFNFKDNLVIKQFIVIIVLFILVGMIIFHYEHSLWSKKKEIKFLEKNDSTIHEILVDNILEQNRELFNLQTRCFEGLVIKNKELAIIRMKIGPNKVKKILDRYMEE